MNNARFLCEIALLYLFQTDTGADTSDFLLMCATNDGLLTADFISYFLVFSCFILYLCQPSLCYVSCHNSKFLPRRLFSVC